MEALNGERRAAHEAFVFARRLLLVFVAGILFAIGAMTPYHIKNIGGSVSPGSATVFDVRDTSGVTTELSMSTAGTASESNEWSTGDLVLLTCSIVALLVLLVHIFRAGSTVGSPRRRIHEHATHLLSARLRINIDGPDRLALCVIRI